MNIININESNESELCKLLSSFKCNPQLRNHFTPFAYISDNDHPMVQMLKTI